MKIIVYVLDGLRADHLSCYGYERNTSPEIDRLADEGCIFRNAFAQSSWTRPSAASLLTSAYPSSHGALVHNSILPKNMPTLPEVLRQNGFRTIGITAMANLAPIYGFANGFDEYYELYKSKYLENMRASSKGRYYGKHQDSASFVIPISEDINELAFTLLNKYRHDDLFLFLWSIDTHIPFAPPAPFKHFCDPFYKGDIDGSNCMFIKSAEDLRYWTDLYDGEISHNDHSIGELIKKLKSLDLYEETSILITSDHGEGLSRKRLGHGGIPYDFLTHVPLIIKLNNQRAKGLKADNLVQLIDLFPTVMEMVDLKSSQLSLQGKSLLPLIQGVDQSYLEQEFVYAEFVSPRGPQICHRAIRTQQWKFIYTHFPGFDASSLLHPKSFFLYLLQRQSLSVNGCELLFNLRDDPYELHNIGKDHPEIAEREMSRLRDLHRFNEAYHRRISNSTPMVVNTHEEDAQLKRHLAELGYID